MGPEPGRPQLGFDTATAFVEAGTSDGQTGHDGGVTEWWTTLGDPATDRLVKATLAGNYDLRASLARLRQSREATRATRADRLPAVNLSASASGRDQGDAGVSVPPVQPGGPDGVPVAFASDGFTEVYDVSLDVSWQADVFGRLARLDQAARLDASAAVYDTLGLSHSLVAQAVRGRVALATSSERLRLAEGNLASLRRTLDAVDARYTAGVGDPVQLRLARENVASAEAQLPALRAEEASSRYALAVLVGVLPGEELGLTDALPPLPPVEVPAVGLPASLLDRRPDLLASEFRARAAQARVGASIAALFPNVTLSANVGTAATEAGDLFGRGTFVYSVIGSLAQPVFDAGRLRSQVRQSRAAVDEAAAVYAGAVLNAVREVNDALARERFAREQADALGRAVTEVRAAEDLARERYGRGVGDLLTVLESERRRAAAEDQLAVTRQAVWEARVNLHLALGGGWGVPGLAGGGVQE